MVDIVIHEVRHAWQWWKGWAGGSNEHLERDAETFVREFLAERRVENDFEKLIVTLAEIGAPLANSCRRFPSDGVLLGRAPNRGAPGRGQTRKAVL